MKLLASFTLVLIFSQALFSQRPEETIPTIDHLNEVNKEWSKQEDQPTEGIAFTDDTERIAYHLKTVISRLRECHTDNSDEAQINRMTLLDKLQEYAQAEIFPQNIYHAERTPYFIDHEGTACAVGHLMRMSGETELADRIRSEHNYDYIRDIKTQGVSAWATLNGFTLDELAWIQPTYNPTTPWCQVGEGFNAEVDEMCSMYYDRIYFSGAFDTIDGSIPCPGGLAYFENGELTCLDDHPLGRIHSMQRLSTSKLFIAGQLQYENESIVAASYENNEWTTYSIPQRPDAIGLRIKGNYFAYSRIVVAIDPQDGTGNNEIWRFDDDTDIWHKLITTNGPILSNENYTFGGTFSSYINHLDSDAMVETRNLVSLSISSLLNDEASSFIGDYIPDSVYCIAHSGWNMYVGGVGDADFPNTLLTRYQNGSFQSLIEYMGPTSYNPGIYDLDINSEYGLVIAGDINVGNTFYFGYGLGSYDVLSGTITPLANLDNAARKIALLDEELFISGPFVSMNGFTEFNHVAKVCSPNSLPEQEVVVSIFPNPSSDFVTIESKEQIEFVEIYDHTLRLIERVENAGKRIDLSNYPSGTYYFHVTTGSGKYPTKVMRF
ncbi:MAG: T9SS type A sorting domain-containing protein [Flavobacteriales bacterium]|nr:T9SS type A sorting domain-containing protein [Flavobacteriales bacterium]